MLKTEQMEASRVRSVVRRLSRRDRLVALLVHADGLTHHEVAQVLDVSDPEVHEALDRVHSAILRSMTRRGGQGRRGGDAADHCLRLRCESVRGGASTNCRSETAAGAVSCGVVTSDSGIGLHPALGIDARQCGLARREKFARRDGFHRLCSIFTRPASGSVTSRTSTSITSSYRAGLR